MVSNDAVTSYIFSGKWWHVNILDQLYQWHVWWQIRAISDIICNASGMMLHELYEAKWYQLYNCHHMTSSILCQWDVVMSLITYQWCVVMSAAANCNLRHIKMANPKCFKMLYNLEHSKMFEKTYHYKMSCDLENENKWSWLKMFQDVRNTGKL